MMFGSPTHDLTADEVREVMRELHRALCDCGADDDHACIAMLLKGMQGPLGMLTTLLGATTELKREQKAFVVAQLFFTMETLRNAALPGTTPEQMFLWARNYAAEHRKAMH